MAPSVNGEVALHAGTLAVTGAADFSGPSTLAIVGGTGAYTGAQGFMHTRNIGGKNANVSAASSTW